MTPALIIFDCDGVLVDSEVIANRIMAESITALGIPMSYDECRARFVGGTLQRVVDTLEQWLERPLPPGWKEDFEARRDAAFRRGLQPITGVAAAIEAIRASGTPICVASSGSMEKMELTLGLTGLRPYFGDNLFCAGMVAQGKPEPDLFHHAAEQMGQMPANCAVVEDSLLGVTAALAAGMRVLAYADGPEADALKAAGAQPFSEMAALPGLLGIDGRVPQGAR